MGKRVVHLHLNHLRIDHHEPQVVRAETKENACDYSINADAFAASCRTGHQGMRHLRQITEDDFPVNILPQNDRNAMFCLRKIVRFQNLTKCNFDLFRVGDFDADGVFARNWGKDIDPFRPRCASKIALKTGDFVNSDAASRINLVSGNRRTPRDITGTRINVKLFERVDQHMLKLFQLGRIRRLSPFEVDRLQ